MNVDLKRFEHIQGIGQIKGPMSNQDANGSLINLINLFDTNQTGYITKLSISAPEGTIAVINNKDIEIGKTEFLEYETGAGITFLSFRNNITKDFIIDFVYKLRI
jgi:hypothetical protein